MQTQYVSCPSCRSQNMAGSGLCTNCGTMLPAPGPMQPVGGYSSTPPGADKKLVAGLCGIFLGGLGVHKFILGYQTEGIIMLAVWLIGLIFLCGIPSMVISIIGIVEGIMYLTKSDEEFSNTYILGKKSWF